MRKYLSFKTILLVVVFSSTVFYVTRGEMYKFPVYENHSYYFSVLGNDSADGSLHHPFRTIHKLNKLPLQGGDIVYFHGGDIFTGSLLIDSSKSGTAESPVTFRSYEIGKAFIHSDSLSALIVYGTKYIHIVNIAFVGSGRKNGNTKDGVIMNSSSDILMDSLDISGFQKAGLLIYASSNITTTHVYAHENGASGIAVEGLNSKKDCRHIYIGYCRAENNPGDPSNLTNHSGNGIVVGHCSGVLIDYCEATNNGWDMPRIGNGPVGIWCYEADSVTIQHCLSYRNKTSAGAADGGGFDLDGGVTNSLIQYCISYENQGSGYGIFQYWGASPWYNNTIRYSISENDGLVSDARAGIHIWNASGDKNQFYNCLFYNNTIYNSMGAAISFSEKSERKDFSFYNNIFVAQDSLVKGLRGIDVFLANDWWSLSKKFNVERVYDFATWVKNGGQEMLSGKVIGFNIDPRFKDPGEATITSASSLKLFDHYSLPANSPLPYSGLELKNLYEIQTGPFDFNQQPAPAKGIGACFGLYKK